MVGEFGLAQHGEQVDERLDDEIANPAIGVETGIDTAAEVVWGATTTEREAAVGGALSVDDEMSGVVEGRAVGETDVLPGAVRKGLGRDHHRVERNHGPSLP